MGGGQNTPEELSGRELPVLPCRPGVDARRFILVNRWRRLPWVVAIAASIAVAVGGVVLKIRNGPIDHVVTKDMQTVVSAPQTISGIIFDERTKQPFPGVRVAVPK